MVKLVAGANQTIWHFSLLILAFFGHCYAIRGSIYVLVYLLVIMFVGDLFSCFWVFIF